MKRIWLIYSAWTLLGLFVLGVMGLTVVSFFDRKTEVFPQQVVRTPTALPTTTETLSPTINITETPTATPTPKPLTFAEMNSLYGPCVNLPVLMYHHIQPKAEAVAAKHGYLNVDPETFRKQMQYLKDKGYTSIFPSDLNNFFDNGVALPKKAVMITVDDGYKDNHTYAFPILKETSTKATIFLPTGLMGVGDYLNWDQIVEMQGSGLLYFGNHTWSHLNVSASREKVKTEISTAKSQLEQRGLDSAKVFAYPYGINNGFAVDLLKSDGYSLAFTTRSGRIQCAKQRLLLPRIRVGDTGLGFYGL